MAASVATGTLRLASTKSAETTRLAPLPIFTSKSPAERSGTGRESASTTDTSTVSTSMPARKLVVGCCETTLRPHARINRAIKGRRMLLDDLDRGVELPEIGIPRARRRTGHHRRDLDLDRPLIELHHRYREPEVDSSRLGVGDLDVGLAFESVDVDCRKRLVAVEGLAAAVVRGGIRGRALHRRLLLRSGFDVREVAHLEAGPHHGAIAGLHEERALDRHVPSRTRSNQRRTA